MLHVCLSLANTGKLIILTFELITDSSVTISFEPVEIPDKHKNIEYVITYHKVGEKNALKTRTKVGEKDVHKIRTNSTRVTVTSLEPDTVYEFLVSAEYEEQVVAESDHVRVRTKEKTDGECCLCITETFNRQVNNT